MNKTVPFFSQGASDPFYNEVRDNPSRKEAHDFVEELWQKYAHYAEPDFLEDAKRHFHEKSWEMYLACVFLNHGFQLNKKRKKKGPDICLLGQTKPIWVEAKAPGSGTGNDAVPEPELDILNDVPEEQILLRLTSAIVEKYKKYQKYLRKGIISKDDPYIIAINGGNIPRAGNEGDDVPHIVKAVLPFGNLFLKINQKGEITVSHYEYRDGIRKCSGTKIPTNIFEDKSYSRISAIMYSWVNVVDRPEQIGTEIIFIHNPFAENPLLKGLSQFGTEYWVENDKLRNKKWSL
jgi:hypothetical protein